MRRNEIYKYTSIVYMSLVFFLLEVIFRLENKLPILAYHAYLFNIAYGLLLGFISRLFSEKVNRILNLVIIGIAVVFYCMQMCLYQMYGFYFEMNLSGAADQVIGFFGEAVKLIISKIFFILLLLIPFICLCLISKKIYFKRLDATSLFKSLLCVVLSCCLFFATLFIKKDEEVSAYQLTFKRINIPVSIETLGVTLTFWVDVIRTLTDFTGEIVIDDPLPEDEPQTDPEEEQAPKEYGFNNLDIDFESLIANEKNDELLTMHKYFESLPGTKKNEYTGMFEGKNLVLFMAESFNEIAVSKEYTPTLYKLIHEGFNFKEFYTPENYSTIGGEFQELTGLLMAYKVSQWRSGENYFPMGIATVFKDLGYTANAYHNNTYTFQDRNVYLKSLGFDKYLGCKNGLEERMSCSIWPKSDLDMVDVTYQDFINEEKFFTYYCTVSGHFDYNFNQGDNYIAWAHSEEMHNYNLGISDGPLAYLAGQMELDRAVASLIKHLEEAGKLEDTVIALVGDHYPYDLTLDEVNELSDYERNETFDIHHSNFILYCAGMEPVTVDKVGYQCDVLPTLYNLFGIDYDSRLFTGRDILSDTPGLAIFADNSWVSDLGKYYYKSKEFVPTTNEEIPENYVKKTMSDVYNRINMAKLIMKTDYYSKVFD